MRLCTRLLLVSLLAAGSMTCGGDAINSGLGTPTKLVLTSQPPATVVSAALLAPPPVVQLEDAASNPVSKAGVAVTAAIASGPGGATLGGTTTVVTSATGAATFIDLIITGPNGDYTLAFSASALTGVTSSSIGVGSPSGRTPITDLGTGTYLGSYQGGLYPGGSNAIPHVQDSVGKARAKNIMPLDANGNPSAAGMVVLLSIGMSSATQEWCNTIPYTPCASWTFTGQALADAAVRQNSFIILNGAKGGQQASTWNSVNDFNYDRVLDSILTPASVTEKQVQAVWLKEANLDPTVSLPSSSGDAYTLETRLGEIVRALRTRYPNLQLVFISSRIYAGYATTTTDPEPYAYETGLSVKWVIQAQIDQMANGGTVVDQRAGNLDYDTVAPWIGWGPYMWADGTTPRLDGLTWVPGDFDPADFTHPSTQGETKVGTILLNFFKTDPHASCWFLAGGVCP